MPKSDLGFVAVHQRNGTRVVINTACIVRVSITNVGKSVRDTDGSDIEITDESHKLLLRMLGVTTTTDE